MDHVSRTCLRHGDREQQAIVLSLVVSFLVIRCQIIRDDTLQRHLPEQDQLG
jgi:hypothetical protein